VVDQIWCPTKFVQNAFLGKSKKLVLAIPLPVIQSHASKYNLREILDIPQDAFVALFMFDLHSTINRKNPQGAIEAFKQFAKNKTDVYLILKINRWQNVARSQLRWLPKDPRIKLVTQTLEAPVLASLYQSANTYLSLHRSEGFGRTLVEALQQGLPVIATNHSGPADFLNENNAKILGWLPQSVFKDDYPFNQLSLWANPVIEDAVLALEELYAQKPYQKLPAAISSGSAFSVHDLAKKYAPILRSYLLQ
jgi:glycosyltransferase involved in cell wall biosynthesis